MKAQTFAILLNSAGLILDIVGAFQLFYERDAGLKQVSKKIKSVKLHFSQSGLPTAMRTGGFRNLNEERIKTEMENHLRHNIDAVNATNTEIANQMAAIIGELNETIATVEESNTARHKKAQRWLVLLGAGFALQLLATLLGLAAV